MKDDAMRRLARENPVPGDLQPPQLGTCYGAWESTHRSMFRLLVRG